MLVSTRSIINELVGKTEMDDDPSPAERERQRRRISAEKKLSEEEIFEIRNFSRSRWRRVNKVVAAHDDLSRAEEVTFPPPVFRIHGPGMPRIRNYTGVRTRKIVDSPWISKHAKPDHRMDIFLPSCSSPLLSPSRPTLFYLSLYIYIYIYLAIYFSFLFFSFRKQRRISTSVKLSLSLSLCRGNCEEQRSDWCKNKRKKKKEGEEQLLFLKTVRKEDWRGWVLLV